MRAKLLPGAAGVWLLHMRVLQPYISCAAGRFLKSETVREFVGFISAMSEAAKGAKVSDECPVSEPVASLLSALRQLSAWVDKIPPLQQAMRYGNPAYRHGLWAAPVAPPSICLPACLHAGLLTRVNHLQCIAGCHIEDHDLAALCNPAQNLVCEDVQQRGGAAGGRGAA